MTYYSIGLGAAKKTKPKKKKSFFERYFKRKYDKKAFVPDKTASYFKQYQKRKYNKNLFRSDTTDYFRTYSLGEIAYSGLGGVGKPVVLIGGAFALAAAAYFLLPEKSAPTFRRRRKR